MNVKKYRATTTREALEMIKAELGENAFVLETKQIRTGGFLGLGSNMKIEVSAAAPAISAQPIIQNHPKDTFTSNRILNLTDDTLAAPQTSKQAGSEQKEKIVTALAMRAALSNDFEAETLPNFTGREPSKIESVEISPDAPRLVHHKKETAKQIAPEENQTVAEIFEHPPAVNSNRELELLRAEMREVKFSLGAFANRQNAYSWQTEVNLDTFGEIFQSPFHDVYIELTALGIPAELARKFVADIVPQFKDNSFNSEQLAQIALTQGLESLIKYEPEILVSGKPATLAVIGSTGVGKTTTVAKIAARVALYEQRPVELVTLDTYRIAAVEQLKTYAVIIGAGCHVVRSVFELDAVLRRLPTEATVLIDTTGRNPHDLADQFELSDYLKNRAEIRKCLAFQATTNPIDASAAIKKFEMYGADCLVITKMDETVRPGAVIETIAESNLPLAYLCTGQRVPEDLQIATAESFAKRIIGKRT